MIDVDIKRYKNGNLHKCTYHNNIRHFKFI